jgi:hypothetical protein
MLNLNERKWFWLSLVLTLVIMAIMNLVGAPLINSTAPSGIVSYELAYSLDKAQAILNSWDARAQLYAAFGLGLDYLFMPAYAITFALACRLAGGSLGRRNWPLAGLAHGLALGMFLAASFDALENLALGIMLLNTPANPWPRVAGVCATLKFGLLLVGLVYALYGLTGALVERFSPSKTPSSTATRG